MKPVLKKICISFVFSLTGLFCFFKFNGDLLLYGAGILMGYLSLFNIMSLYPQNTHDKIYTKVLKKIAVVSFSFAVLGISFGIIHELLGAWSLSIMANYWFLMLILYVTNLFSLVILVFANQNEQHYPWFYRILILLNLLLTFGPVLLPIFILILGNGMNAHTIW
ncbi:DUF3902 family protein [Bacillus cereus]|uniref:DUF3902 family protein n=3 Tax=Bacillus cereus group TaxID=86661 RepID=UPI00044CF438|nr:DUF3902 family protein [Bacillus thuringiensis]MEB8637007.1 DUF3902 family protein [Bacillus cereus]EXY05175.1 hypothetical protein BF15_03715 [Bacillus thuringiensis]MEB8743441.1 DUF3902 family protein [Bacillus cereus]MEB8799778.1 DUF3902 family protein [Bacillus cereus]MEB8807819.1 DUF3902 family protein [Bacillus cereus]